jgi:hypothetical protein
MGDQRSEACRTAVVRKIFGAFQIGDGTQTLKSKRNHGAFSRFLIGYPGGQGRDRSLLLIENKGDC